MPRDRFNSSPPPLQRCDRCSIEEDIPTFQCMKLDDEVKYLCSLCWFSLRAWFYGKKQKDLF